MDNKQLILIIIAILAGACIIAGGLFFGLQANQDQENNLTDNNTTVNNTANVTLINNDSDNSNTVDNRPAVDSKGTTREEADYYGYTYTKKHGGNYIGSNDHWDENAQTYHD